MVKVSLLALKLLLLLVSAGWISLWILKPTELWTRKWKEAEEKASASAFGYNGLAFAVYTFPVSALAVFCFFYFDLKPSESKIRLRKILKAFSSPLVIRSYLGILTGLEILASSLFVVFLVWTFYARISNDFRKTVPVKSFKLSIWQYKMFRVATRCGLLAEACQVLLLLPVLRGMSIFQLLGIQFEASVKYHVWLGTVMVFFATLHGAGTFFIWGVKHRIQDEMWKWQKTGRIYLAGELALATALVIWITSLPKIRRKWFEVFYYTHHLYVVFLVFFLFHGGDRHFYMVLPGVFLFALDKLLRIIQSRSMTCILSAQVFPCEAIELTLPKDPRLKYAPTSIIFLKIPSISKYQWHPFSITSTSSTNEQTLSIIIKSEGKWTSSLHTLILAEPDAEANQRKCIPVVVEGPYGPRSLHLRYDNLLLVAGGIGITPFLSILQEIASNIDNATKRYPARIQLIFTVKTSKDIALLDPIILQLIDIDRYKIKLKIFVTRENLHGTTLKEVLGDLQDMQIMNFSTHCSDHVANGCESLKFMAAMTLLSSVAFLILLMCSNHFIIPPAKKSNARKYPSSLVDILLICSFAIAITFSSLVAIIVRWKKLKKEVSLFSGKQRKPPKQGLLEANRGLDEHEIHFGGRPSFQGLLANFAHEYGASDVGVLVCGPESMKESVALACKLSYLVSETNDMKKSCFRFHSLNFTL